MAILCYNPYSHGFAREFCCANQPNPKKGDGAVLSELKTRAHAAGLKQTLRAVRSGKASRVFLARDADPALIQPLRSLCEERGVPVWDGCSMHELGEAAGIAVGAASAAVIGT